MAKYKKPFADVLPALTEAETQALKQRIKDEGGIHDPVLITESDEVLDGHNRLAIDPKAPTKHIPGSGDWSEAQKRAFVIRCNRGRRNLSPEADKAIEKTSKEIAADLKREGKTQKEIAVMFGVSQPRVQQWLAKIISNIRPPYKANNGDGASASTSTIPDCRTKVSDDDRDEIHRRLGDGEPQQHIADDLGISQGRVAQIAKEPEKKKDKAPPRPKKPQPWKTKQFKRAVIQKLDQKCSAVWGLLDKPTRMVSIREVKDQFQELRDMVSLLLE